MVKSIAARLDERAAAARHEQWAARERQFKAFDYAHDWQGYARLIDAEVVVSAENAIVTLQTTTGPALHVRLETVETFTIEGGQLLGLDAVLDMVIDFIQSAPRRSSDFI